MERTVSYSALVFRQGGSKKDSRDETVRHTVAERDESYSDERGHGIANVAPVDSCDLSYHQTADLGQDARLSVIMALRSCAVQPKRILTRIRVQPVAHGGIDAKIGAKKMDTKKHNPVTMAVNPVRPPSAIPAPLSMKAVTGEHPNSEPMEIHPASMQYATVDRGKSPSFPFSRCFLAARSFFCCTRPQNRAIEYNVAVQSMMSTYRKVNSASANDAP